MVAEPGSGTGRGSMGAGRADARWSGIAATFTLGILGGTFVWWALKEGAYFGTVMYPGVALLALGLIVLVVTVPWRASFALSRPARLAVISLVALAAWSLLSAFWSPTPDIAVEDAQRIVGYALIFGLGVWACALLGRRMELSMLPVVGAAGIVALVTLIQISGASVPLPYLEEDGTLQHPLAYRNANAAFFLIALWPALCLAASPRIHTAVRIGSFVTATACLELAILSQSRGSILAVGAALLVYVLSARRRLNALSWFVLAAFPASLSVFDANALFEAAEVGTGLEGTVDEMNAAGSSGLLRLVVAGVIAFIATRIEPRIRLSPRWGLVVALTIVLAATIAVVATVGNPISWTGERAEEFCEGEADFSQEANRLTFNTGSNRCEIWRVALNVTADDPVFGEGGGGFQFRFNRERNIERPARDAHSVELEMLSELGVVGFALFGAAIIGAFAGAMRVRRLGPASAQLSCGALAAGTYWLVHASADWFWPYPAVTAPAFALLGAAVAPSLLMPDRTTRPRNRRLLILLSAVLALSLVPPFLSERLVARALDTFRADTEAAYSDLALARDLNPLTDVPALTEGSIALELEDRERAIAAFREAVRKRPEEYVGHFFLALILARDDPEQARSELALVAEMNPLEARLDELERRIEAGERRIEGTPSP